MNELLNLDGIEFSKTALIIDKKLSFDAWLQLGEMLRTWEGAYQFWIGDYLNFGEKRYGEKYAQAVDEQQADTWRQYAYVARSVEMSTRVDILGWSHHREVASLDPTGQKQWLDIAARGEEGRPLSVHELRKRINAAAAVITSPLPVGDAEIRHCDMETLLGDVKGIDAIITDPPYSKEYLPIYGKLAELSSSALSSDGLLAVMTGQSYLPQIFNLMCQHIKYRWTMAYLTPGGQSPQIWDRKVNTFWKPVLVFGMRDVWLGDVVNSDVNDNDKRFHEWGQAEEGIGRLVDKLSKPGDLICDPFVGGGTTAVVCMKLGRRFIGSDQDIKAIEVTKRRLCI